MQDEQDSRQSQLGTAQEASGSRSGGALGTELMPDRDVLKRIRTLSYNRNSSMQEIADVVVRDAVTTLEFLRIANAMFFVQDRPSILTAKTAIVRLGSENIMQLVDRLESRPRLSSRIVREAFELLRSEAGSIAVVARIIASASYREMADIVQTAGLMTNIGHMIACSYYQEKYAQLVLSLPRPTVVYRLAQEFHFDVRSIQLTYLRMHGLPQALFYALDRELVCKTPGQSNMRFVVESAHELVAAHASNKWERYLERDKLPTKSALRLLKVNNIQYEQLVTHAKEYLEQGTAADVSPDIAAVPPSAVESIGPGDLAPLEDGESYGSQEDVDDSSTYYVHIPARQSPNARSQEFTPSSFDADSTGTYDIEHAESEFAAMRLQTPEYIVDTRAPGDEEERPLGERGQQVLADLERLCEQCQTAEDLLTGMLALLVTEAPFLRAALIVISRNRSRAFIHAGLGEGFHAGVTIHLDDPLSPLSLCLTKVKSFGKQGVLDSLSPFGNSAYALSPIMVKADSPVVLYADCGLDKPITFESRKVFRRVVALLNRTLPTLPGGLPESSEAS